MAIRTACAARIGSVIELRQGRVPNDIAEMVTARASGLFPQPGDIVASCECGNATTMCKHAAAVLLGIGSRLDEHPDLLFLLRGVDETELIAAEAARSRDTVAPGDLEPCATPGAPASKEADSRPPNATRGCGVESVCLRPDVDRLGRAIPPREEDAHVSTAHPDQRPPAPPADPPRCRGRRIRADGRDGLRPARALRMFGGRVRGADPGHADDGAPLGSHASTCTPLPGRPCGRCTGSAESIRDEVPDG